MRLIAAPRSFNGRNVTSRWKATSSSGGRTDTMSQREYRPGYS